MHKSWFLGFLTILYIRANILSIGYDDAKKEQVNLFLFLCRQTLDDIAIMT